MEDLSIACRIVLIIIFLSSAYSKVFNYGGFLLTIKNYKIINRGYLHITGLSIIGLEIIFGVGLFYSTYLTSIAIGSILLLIAYCFALYQSIGKDNKDLMCGCGGVLGEQKISISIVIRNVILILMALLVINYNSSISLLSSEIIKLKNLHLLFMSFSFVLLLRIFPVVFEIKDNIIQLNHEINPKGE